MLIIVDIPLLSLPPGVFRSEKTGQPLADLRLWGMMQVRLLQKGGIFRRLSASSLGAPLEIPHVV